MSDCQASSKIPRKFPSQIFGHNGRHTASEKEVVDFSKAQPGVEPTTVKRFSPLAAASVRRPGRCIAVVGANDYSRKFAARLADDPKTRIKILGVYKDEEEPLEETSGSPSAYDLKELIVHNAQNRIDAVVIMLPLSDVERIQRVRTALRSLTTDIYLAGEIIDLACGSVRMNRLGPNAVLKIGGKPMSDKQIMAKNIVDRLFSVLLLILALPVLALIALAVHLDSRGPLLFRQPRLGLHNTMFTMYKFRTMYADMADVAANRQATLGDPRVTRVGRILRRTSLDELPQLINVVRGDMSLVGPRPHAPNTKAGDKLFHEVVADYPLRHRVKPGITGWAQVNGWRGETRTYQQIERRVACDLYYIEHWSLWFDFKILLMTARHQITSKAAY
jgi:Undecaprenyl-phosphate glucose phosphotransferase